MKKVTVIALVAFLLVSLPTVTLAQGNQQVRQAQDSYGVQQQDRVQDPAMHEGDTTVSPQGNQVQNQNQIVTQNQGEESKLQVATQHMEQLIDMGGVDEEVGQKIGAVAQQQVQAQSQIQNQLDKLESKSAFMKKLFGPDYKAIKALKQQMEQNQLRIQQLQQLQTEVVNQADETQLQEAVQALIEQNTALEKQVAAEEKVGSLFGWLVRLFSK